MLFVCFSNLSAAFLLCKNSVENYIKITCLFVYELVKLSFIVSVYKFSSQVKTVECIRILELLDISVIKLLYVYLIVTNVSVNSEHQLVCLAIATELKERSCRLNTHLKPYSLFIIPRILDKLLSSMYFTTVPAFRMSNIWSPSTLLSFIRSQAYLVVL